MLTFRFVVVHCLRSSIRFECVATDAFCPCAERCANEATTELNAITVRPKRIKPARRVVFITLSYCLIGTIPET